MYKDISSKREVLKIILQNIFSIMKMKKQTKLFSFLKNEFVPFNWILY